MLHNFLDSVSNLLTEVHYFLNSVLVTAATIVLVLILSAMSAYAIARMKWKLSNATMTLILLGMMVPIHSALLPLFMVLRNLNLLNTYWALIIPYVAFGLPVAVYIIASFFKAFPAKWKIGGHGRMRRLPRVLLHHPAACPAGPGHRGDLSAVHFRLERAHVCRHLHQ